ncbi:hypothetical protein [Bathycoccus sp. RCC716 virus 3]|nr:hypothetical protein [Bathycoccus sp. RCC716 virus 3]
MELPNWLKISLVLSYVLIASLGINTFQNCPDIQDSQKWKNIKMFLSHTLTIAMIVPIILLLKDTDFLNGDKMYMLYAILGFIASAMSLGMANDSKCKEKGYTGTSTIFLIGYLAMNAFLIYKIVEGMGTGNAKAPLLNNGPKSNNVQPSPNNINKLMNGGKNSIPPNRR